MRISICRFCGSVIETKEEDRDRCYCCPTHQSPPSLPQDSDDPDAFKKANHSE